MMTYKEHQANPCRECRNRSPACHDRCESYKSWNAARLRVKKIAEKKHDMNQMFADYRKHAIENMSTKHCKSWTAKHRRRLSDESPEMEEDKRKLCEDSVHVPNREMD